jgi:hypothetical protein
LIKTRTSSIRPAFIKLPTRVAPPTMYMSLPGCCLSFRISSRSRTNHDGKLTWDEWNVPGSGRSKANFDAADTNKDGSLSLDEALAYGRKRGVFKEEFQEADTNHDGYVTREEAKAYYASKEGPPD